MTRRIVLFGVATLTIVQIILGYRWQLIPAYILVVAFLIVLTVRIYSPQWVIPRKVKTFLLILGGIVLAVAIALPLLMPVFSFPNPSGKYGIGTVTYRWVDSERQEVLSAKIGDYREVVAQIWYPTNETSGNRELYIEESHAIFNSVAEGLKETTGGKTELPFFFGEHLKDVKTNALQNVPIATNQETYPVIVHLSGLGGFRSANTLQIEELVSHGYIVVGVDQPYISAYVKLSDGSEASMLSRQEIHRRFTASNVVNTDNLATKTHLPDDTIPYLAADAQFVISALHKLNNESNNVIAKHLNMHQVGIFGVSLGGRVVAETCRQDERIKGCLMIDTSMPQSVVEAGLKQPALWLTRSADDMRQERQRTGGWSEENIKQTIDSMRAVFVRQPSGAGYYVSIAGMSHIDFTDAPHWIPFTSQLGISGTIDTQKGGVIVNEYIRAFFDKTLKDQDPSLLHSPSPYPEVLLEHR